MPTGNAGSGAQTVDRASEPLGARSVLRRFDLDDARAGLQQRAMSKEVQRRLVADRKRKMTAIAKAAVGILAAAALAGWAAFIMT